LPIAIFNTIKEHALPSGNAAPDVLRPFHTGNNLNLFEDNSITLKLQFQSEETD
jgi:hypothetical protein